MSEPVTLFISRRVKAGCEDRMEAWTQGIRAAAAGFPGYLGSQTLERHGERRDTFDVIVHFDSVKALVAWQESETCRQWYRELEPMIEDERMSRLQGYEPWFPPPERLSCAPRPNKWKMWVVTFLCVYPLVNLTLFALGPLMGGLPVWARLLVSVPIVSYLMAFFVMPFLSRVFANWLYPRQD
ncbi:hypothetical protein H5P28_15625 [Ruficoccus amylovorans]|uniref:Antibiotic biosynthesis monooxygenase n=1 Tax=Ruficoccus amylovorans TaxID=1804625 RepID=A0A842HJN4_9BACT|nr:hypothetical protein [Ruficoccus amylovorans]MBC2595697.1 hypothetical protein [Ruficoccus amylovorans]